MATPSSMQYVQKIKQLTHLEPSKSSNIKVLHTEARQIAENFELKFKDREDLNSQITYFKLVNGKLAELIYTSDQQVDIKLRMELSGFHRKIEEHIFALESEWVRLDLQEEVVEPQIADETHHANTAYFLSYVNLDGESVRVGVYKPALTTKDGLRTGVVSKEQHYRERAAYVFANYLNELMEQSYDCFDFGPFRVPVTTIEAFEHPTFGHKHTVGSFQRFVPNTQELDVFVDAGRVREIPIPEFVKLFIFDSSILSLDSHHGNELVGKSFDQNVLFLIDNGLCLPSIEGVKETSMEWANLEFVATNLSTAWKKLIFSIDRFKVQERISQDLKALGQKFIPLELEVIQRNKSKNKDKPGPWALHDTVYVLMRSSIKYLQAFAKMDLSLDEYMYTSLERKKFFLIATKSGQDEILVVKTTPVFNERAKEIRKLEDQGYDVRAVTLSLGQHFQKELMGLMVQAQLKDKKFQSPQKDISIPNERTLVASKLVDSRHVGARRKLIFDEAEKEDGKNGSRATTSGTTDVKHETSANDD